MKELGYIVSKHKINIKCDYVKVVKDINEAKEDKPCLIIGLSEAKKYASDNFSILRKQISENVSWTYDKTEKRTDYEDDIKNFNKNILNNYLNNIKYIYLNILNLNYNILKRFLKYINNINKKYIYISKNMAYVQCENKSVVGISLDMAEFCNINSQKVIDKFKQNKNNIIIDDISRFSKKMQLLLQHKQYAVPYIMELEE